MHLGPLFLGGGRRRKREAARHVSHAASMACCVGSYGGGPVLAIFLEDACMHAPRPFLGSLSSFLGLDKALLLVAAFLVIGRKLIHGVAVGVYEWRDGRRMNMDYLYALFVLSLFLEDCLALLEPNWPHVVGFLFFLTKQDLVIVLAFKMSLTGLLVLIYINQD